MVHTTHLQDAHLVSLGAPTRVFLKNEIRWSVQSISKEVLGLLGNHIAEEYGIPMRARMIHTVGGDTYPVPYGEKDQCIYSVGRRYVNEILLTGIY